MRGRRLHAGRTGLKRSDRLWKALGKAAVLHHGSELPLILLTTEAPGRGSAGQAALNALTGPGLPVLDVIELLSARDRERLRAYAHRGWAHRG